MKRTVSRRGALLLGVWMVAGAISVVPAVGLAAPAISIDIGPPPPRAEIAPRPRRGFVWAPGYWAWRGRGHRHVWVPGHWMRAPRLSLDTGPLATRGRHWQFVPGRWQR